jgi:hypothetical protein
MLTPKGEHVAGYFSPDALDDPEICDLTDDAHRAWIVLCIQRNPRCGIFKLNSRLLSARCRTPMDRLPACLDDNERLNWIRRDHSSGYLWIINYTRHQSKQAEWLSKARQEAEKLKSVTYLGQYWIDYYSDIKSKSDLISLAISPPISPPSDRTDSLQDRTGQPVEPLQPAKRGSRDAAAETYAKRKALDEQACTDLIEIEKRLPDDMIPPWVDCKTNLLDAHPTTGARRVLGMLQTFLADCSGLRIAACVYGLEQSALHKVDDPRAIVNYAKKAARSAKLDDGAYYSGETLREHMEKQEAEDVITGIPEWVPEEWRDDPAVAKWGDIYVDMKSGERVSAEHYISDRTERELTPEQRERLTALKEPR